MNISFIKENLRELLGKNVLVKEYVGRNKHENYSAIVYQMYPNLFILKKGEEIKTFSYSDVLVKNIILKEKSK